MGEHRIKTLCYYGLMTALCMIGILIPSQSYAVEFVTRPDSEYLILGIVVNDVSRDEGIEAYLPESSSPENLLVPLNALAEALSFAIETDPGSGLARGWFRSEDNMFQLDLSRNEVFLTNKTITLPPLGAEPHIDDIYVQASLLEKWFDLNITLDLSLLELRIKTNDPLPFQMERIREERARQYLNRPQKNFQTYENARAVPYHPYSWPTILLSENLTYSHAPSTDSIQTNTNVHGSMDFLYFGTNFTFGYQTNTAGENELNTSDLTFQRRDPSRQLLGPLNAGRLALGDISFPSVPLLFGSKRGAGAIVSSDPKLGFRYASNPDNYSIEAEAPPEWDAELYRNGFYIAFQDVGNDGRVEFNNISLTDGYNQFEIVLYGPDGQKRIITREVYRGASMLYPGELYYNIAAGLPESEFLPITPDSKDDSRLGFSSEFLYGISNFLTVGASAYTGPDEDNETTAASVTAVTALGRVNAQGRVMFADKGRTAYELLGRTRLWGSNLSGRFISYDNFDPDNQDLSEEVQLTLSRSFDRYNISFSATDRSFIDREDDLLLENIFSAEMFDINVTNTLKRIIADNDALDDFEGDLALQTSIWGGVRTRVSWLYDLDSDADDLMKSLRLSADKNLGDSSVGLNTSYDFLSETTRGDLRYSRDIGPVALDFNIGASTEDTYYVGVGVRTALQPEIGRGYSFVDRDKASQASLGVRAFIDENANDVFDEGEEVLPELAMRATRSGTKGMTDKDGVAWLHGMVEMPTGIVVDAATIDSIYHTPAEDSYELIPRRGANTIIDFPFVRLGEVDGFVTGLESTSENTITVSIYNTNEDRKVSHMRIEDDGYFFFSALTLGKYILKATSSSGEILAEKEVSLTGSEPIVMNLSLDIGSQNSRLAAIKRKTIPFDKLSPRIALETDQSQPDYPPEQNTYLVHLGSLKHSRLIRDELERLRREYHQVLDGAPLKTTKVVIGPGEIFHRIIGGPVLFGKAVEICEKLSDINPGGCNIMKHEQNISALVEVPIPNNQYWMHFASHTDIHEARENSIKTILEMNEFLGTVGLILRKVTINDTEYWRLLGTPVSENEARFVCRKVNKSKQSTTACRVLPVN